MLRSRLVTHFRLSVLGPLCLTFAFAVASLAAACGSDSVGGPVIGRACVTSGNCGGAPCVPIGGTERACTHSCVAEVDCPPGWACEEFGGVGDVCRCDSEPELCNSADDDCDGVIDEECGAPICGDGTCNGLEDCETCEGDCGPCATSCGDGTCEGAEDCEACAEDCGACECGDGACNGDEACESCEMDCGACPASCGDGTCNGDEDCESCEMDCGACCPDGGEEPNDVEEEAMRQGRPAPYSCGYTDTASGVLDDGTDADWFIFPGSDTRVGGCTHSASVSVSGLEVCLYASCATTPTPDEFSCTSGAAVTSPMGRAGCCSTAGAASLRVVCTTGSGTATSFYVEVGGAEARQCVAYEATYRSASP